MANLDFIFTTILPPLTSGLLLIIVFFQFRIQREEFLPDLVVPRAAHYESVCNEDEKYADPSEIKDNQLLFEIENLGNGKATRVRAESLLYELNSGRTAEDGLNSDLFSHETSPPETLGLDVFRADVYHSSWKDSREATISGGQPQTAYLTELDVAMKDKPKSLDRLLRDDYPAKSAARLRIRLLYDDTFAFKDYRRDILDLVIFPGQCSNMKEAIESGMQYERYLRIDHDDAILDAKTEVEKLREE